MSKIRKSARGQICLVRLPGICSYNPEETIAAHKNGGGISLKSHDIHSARCCAKCHAVVDSLPRSNMVEDLEQAKQLLYFYEGILRTQMELLKEGLITVKK